MEHKIPPQNLEAEQSVLGSVLIDNSSIVRISDVITSKDFYREAHKKIFDCMMELTILKEGIDLITLTDLLKKKGISHFAIGLPEL